MKRTHLVAAVAAVALAGTALGGPAGADSPEAKPRPKVLAKDLLSPLSLAVTDDGTVFYTQNFAGLLHMKAPRQAPQVVYASDTPGTEVGAVSVAGSSVRFATTFAPEEGQEGEPHTALMQLGANGEATELADLWTYEEESNPDGGVVYGLRGLDEDCEVPEDFAPYQGIVESHPYATAQHQGRTFIADAAGNTILKYGRGGRLSTVAVLPAQPIKVTRSLAQAFGMPRCAVGLKYYFEAVPTDVEVGPNGGLYVTLLPGGPEDPSLGKRASVYRVNPHTGKTKRMVRGLLSATGLAVGKKGRLFVAELFGGRIARGKAGTDRLRTLLKAGLPGDVELRRNGDLYATVQVLPGEEEPPAGQVVRIRR